MARPAARKSRPPSTTSSSDAAARQDARTELTPLAETRLGQALCGDSLELLTRVLKPTSVDLVMTSPPFGLVRKKSYGNEDAEQYLEWFAPFAEGIRRVLKPEGSLVIDIGGAWKPGLPARSLYHFKLLIFLCEQFGFHLAQEYFWWNPAKLPGPAEWVNIRRIRVKDAVNCVWWLSPTPWPRANNRRVLAPYSDAMKRLLKTGYNKGLRPSGHDISDKWQRDNGGAVPPNLLAIPNTRSNDPYQRYCRRHNLVEHPARFPAELPAYFMAMLTNPGDLVVDPFGGSGMTGAVAERLGRRWYCCELNADFLRGIHGYLEEPDFPNLSVLGEPYEVFPPRITADSENPDFDLSTGQTRAKARSSRKGAK